MSHSDSESDIWEYKSLKKTKRQDKTPKSSEDGSKRRRLAKQGASKKKSNKTCRGSRLSSAESKTAINVCTESESVQVTKADGPLTKSSLPSGSQSTEVHDGSSSEQHPQSRGYCPVCQMPFSILVIQTAQWHVAECLENPGETSKGMPLHQDITLKRNIKVLVVHKLTVKPLQYKPCIRLSVKWNETKKVVLTKTFSVLVFDRC